MEPRTPDRVPNSTNSPNSNSNTPNLNDDPFDDPFIDNNPFEASKSTTSNHNDDPFTDSNPFDDLNEVNNSDSSSEYESDVENSNTMPVDVFNNNNNTAIGREIFNNNNNSHDITGTSFNPINGRKRSRGEYEADLAPNNNNIDVEDSTSTQLQMDLTMDDDDDIMDHDAIDANDANEPPVPDSVGEITGLLPTQMSLQPAIGRAPIRRRLGLGLGLAIRVERVVERGLPSPRFNVTGQNTNSPRVVVAQSSVEFVLPIGVEVEKEDETMEVLVVKADDDEEMVGMDTDMYVKMEEDEEPIEVDAPVAAPSPAPVDMPSMTASAADRHARLTAWIFGPLGNTTPPPRTSNARRRPSFDKSQQPPDLSYLSRLPSASNPPYPQLKGPRLSFTIFEDATATPPYVPPKFTKPRHSDKVAMLRCYQKSALYQRVKAYIENPATVRLYRSMKEKLGDQARYKSSEEFGEVVRAMAGKLLLEEEALAKCGVLILFRGRPALVYRPMMVERYNNSCDGCNDFRVDIPRLIKGYLEKMSWLISKLGNMMPPAYRIPPRYWGPTISRVTIWEEGESEEEGYVLTGKYLRVNEDGVVKNIWEKEDYETEQRAELKTWQEMWTAWEGSGPERREGEAPGGVCPFGGFDDAGREAKGESRAEREKARLVREVMGEAWFEVSKTGMWSEEGKVIGSFVGKRV